PPAGGSRARTSRAARSRSARCSPARTRSAPAFALLGLRSDHRGPGPVLRSSRLIGDRAGGGGLDLAGRGARGGRVPHGDHASPPRDAPPSARPYAARPPPPQARDPPAPPRLALIVVLPPPLPPLPSDHGGPAAGVDRPNEPRRVVLAGLLVEEALEQIGP